MRGRSGFGRQLFRLAPAVGLLLALVVTTPVAAEGLRLPFLGTDPVLDLTRSSAGESDPDGDDENQASTDEDTDAPTQSDTESLPTGSDSTADGAEEADGQPAAAEAPPSAEENSSSSLIGLACSLRYRNGDIESLLAEPRISTLCGLEVTITAGRDAPEDVPLYEASFRVERLNGNWRLGGGAMARSRAGGLIAQTTYRQSGAWEEPIDLLLHLPAGERSFQLRCVATQY